MLVAYVPAVPTCALVILSVVDSVCAAVSRFVPPSRVSFKSDKSNPLIDSLKPIVIEIGRASCREGETGVMVAVGAILSTTNDVLGWLPSKLPAGSAIPEPAAVIDRT